LSSCPLSVLDSVIRVCNPILFTHDQFGELSDADIYVASRKITSFMCLPVRVDAGLKIAFWLERTGIEADFSFAELDGVEALLNIMRPTFDRVLGELTLADLQKTVSDFNPANVGAVDHAVNES